VLLALRGEDLPPRMGCFDTVFSMGVIYHRRAPLEHLAELLDALRPGGELVLETLVIPGDAGQILMPEERYAKMRNVWFIPSAPAMLRWLRRAGFHAARLIDERCHRPTSSAPPWMRFESLADFLDPQRPELTVEGYPAPRRALFSRTDPVAEQRRCPILCAQLACALPNTEFTCLTGSVCNKPIVCDGNGR
jgi:tRNA (mo5U34)-methyltransferase